MPYDDSSRMSHTYGNNGPGAVLNTISTVGIVVGFFLILNRLYWRWKKGTPGIDDVIIVLAWVALVILGVVTYFAVSYGYGRKTETLTRDEASDAIRMFYLYQIFYKLSLNLSKLSILTLYLRVFDNRDWFGRITQALIFLVVTYTVSIITANIFICSPIRTYWNTRPQSHPSWRDSSCINVLAYWYASSLYNILSETLMLLSVLVRIWTLPSHSQPPILQLRQKINLTIVLGLGVFTVTTAILRTTTLDHAEKADKTSSTLLSTTWSSVEVSLGLAIANLPMMRQLLRWRGWCGGRWFSSTAGKSRHETSRRPSEHTPAPNHSGLKSPSPSRTHPRDPLGRDISASEIRMQRDFHREVVTGNDSVSSSSENSTNEDVEAQTLTPTSSPSISAHPTFRQVAFASSNHFNGFPSPTKAFRSTSNIMSTEIRGGTDSCSYTPSIASTLTPRSPTEPMPMVRISTEPRSSSLHSAVMQPMVQAHVKGA